MRVNQMVSVLVQLSQAWNSPTAVAYDTSESLDAATFEKVLEKVVFLKNNCLF